MVWLYRTDCMAIMVNGPLTLTPKESPAVRATGYSKEKPRPEPGLSKDADSGARLSPVSILVRQLSAQDVMMSPTVVGTGQGTVSLKGNEFGSTLSCGLRVYSDCRRPGRRRRD